MWFTVCNSCCLCGRPLKCVGYEICWPVYWDSSWTSFVSVVIILSFIHAFCFSCPSQETCDIFKARFHYACFIMSWLLINQVTKHYYIDYDSFKEFQTGSSFSNVRIDTIFCSMTSLIEYYIHCICFKMLVEQKTKKS